MAKRETKTPNLELHLCTRAAGVLTVKVLVSLGEGGLQVGAKLRDWSFQVRAALLTQLFLHLQSAARIALRTHLQVVSWYTEAKWKSYFTFTLEHRHLYNPE